MLIPYSLLFIYPEKSIIVFYKFYDITFNLEVDFDRLYFFI